MKIINFLLLLLVSTIIAGCAAPTVIHLNKRYLSDEKAQAVKHELESAGFDVEVNELKFPREITSTSIVHSPLLLEPDALKKTENVIVNLGYELDAITSLASNNHWYTKNTVGLYIVPDGVSTVNSVTLSTLAGTYESRDCDITSSINLSSDGTFSYQDSENKSLTGRWSISGYPYILLEKPSIHLNYYFEIEESEVIDKIGKVSITTLQPRSSAREINKCEMQAGLRS